MKKFAVIIAVLSACVYSGAGIAMDQKEVGKEIHIANTDETDEEMNKLIASLAERAMKKVNEKAQKQLEENIRTAIDKAIDEMASKVAGS